MSADAELIAQLRARAEKAEAESSSLLRRLQLIGEAAENYEHAEDCTFDGHTGCTCVLSLVDVDVSLAPSGAALLERLQAAEARTTRMEQDRDEWRTQAMYVDRHPVVVALRREKHDLANRVVGAEDTVCAIRLEFERRDMDATNPIQAVRDVIEGFMSRTVALTEAKEKLQALELVAKAARQTDEQGHHDGCSALDDDWADGCTCPLLTLHDALAAFDTKAVSRG